MAPELISNDLQASGWAALSLGADSVASITEAVLEVAQTLGPVAFRRDGTAVESLSPHECENARVASLSRKFGIGALPLHCDTAHWVIPCRYIVFACLETGLVNAPTVLLDTQAVALSYEERQLARSASFIVRNGRKSFYANLIDGFRSFVRLDPGCMEPLTEASAEAMNLYSYNRQRDRIIEYRWNAGDILVIDNWRVLHGRGNEKAVDKNRQLLRAYVQ